MKVIILCGGKGTRLKEETEYKPKPMVYIGNQPIIWHIMKIYASFGYNEFIFALGYRSDYIKEFFLNQKAYTSDFTLHTNSYKTQFHLENRKSVDNFKITFVDTGIETPIGERILKCASYIPKNDKHFMVTYGDGVANIDIHDLVHFHKKQKTIATITGVHPHSKYGLLTVGPNNKIVAFQEKPVLSDWVNGGYMVFTKEIFKYINAGEMEHPALKRLSDKKELSLFKHNSFWYSIDTYKEYEELNEIWASGNAPWKVWKD